MSTESTVASTNTSTNVSGSNKSVKGVETEIKLKLSSYPLDIKTKGSVRILQTYYDTKNPDVITAVRDVLAGHMSSEQITESLESASEIRTRMTLETPNVVKYKLTLKSDGDVSRTEIEVPIDNLQYNILRTTYAEIGSILKTRYRIGLTLTSSKTQEVRQLVIELDDYDYDPRHEDLVTAEVEFDPMVFDYNEIVSGVTHHIVQGSSCKILIHDVTFDKRYKNKNLATAKIPIAKSPVASPIATSPAAASSSYD